MNIDKKAFAALAEKPRLKPFAVPGIGDVQIAELTVEEVDAIGKADNTGPSAIQWLRYGVRDKEGEHLFSDEDLPMLRKLPHQVASPLASEVISFNGLAKKSPEEAKND